MIVEYHRPENLEEALRLIARENPPTRPLAGGTVINQNRVDDFAVVDLQNLGLDFIRKKGNSLHLGATINLHTLTEPVTSAAQEHVTIQEALVEAVKLEGTFNTRQAATIAGTLVAGDGRSSLLTCLLALDTQLIIQPGDKKVKLGDFLPLRGINNIPILITEIILPTHAQLAFQQIARTPADLPIVCVSVSKWSSGRTRVALGGYSDQPVLAFDGTEPDGAEFAAEEAFREADDQWGSAAYRSEMAGLLTRRCLEQIERTER